MLTTLQQRNSFRRPNQVHQRTGLGWPRLLQHALQPQAARQANAQAGNVYYTTLWCQLEPGLAITAGSLATLRKLTAVIRARLGRARDEGPPANGSSGGDSLAAAGSPRKARANDLSTTASDLSTRGRSHAGPPPPARGDAKGEAVGALTRWIDDDDDDDDDDDEGAPPREDAGADGGRRAAPPPAETRTARGLAYESRFKYEPPYRPSEAPEEAVEQVGVEAAQPAHGVTRFCEAGESWSPKGRRKNGRRERDLT
jgi:hypothetical protein